MKTILLSTVAALVAWQAAVPTRGEDVQIKPVAVASFSGYQELRDDIALLGKVGGNPQLADMAESVLALVTGFKGLVGIDKSKPWGAAAVTDGKEFRGYAFVPVKDLDKLLDALIVWVGVPEDEGDGILSIVVADLDDRILYIKEQEGWAYIAHDPNMLVDLPADPAVLLDGLNDDHDLAVRVYPQNVPWDLRRSGVETLTHRVEHALKQRRDGETEDQHRQRVRAAREHVQAAAELLNQVEGLTLGFTLDHDAKQLRLDLRLTAVPGSEMARELAEAGQASTRFAGFDRPDAVVSLGLAHPSPPKEMADLVAMLRRQLLDEIGAGGPREKPTDGDASHAQAIVNHLFDLAGVAARADRLDGGMALVGRGPFRLIAGRYVGDGAAADKSIRALLDSVQGGAGVSDVQLDMAQHGGVTFHGLTVTLPPPALPSLAGRIRPPAQALAAADLPVREDLADGDTAGEACCPECEQAAAIARAIFGQEIPIVVGASQDSVYLGIGQNALEVLQEAIDQSREAGEQPAASARLRVRLGPIVSAFADTDPDNLMTAAMARVLSQRKQDELKLTVESIPNGLALRVEGGEGLISMLGVMAVIQATSGGLGGF